jgi:hypothetical protein
MTEITTAAELRNDIVQARGGIDRFDGVQQRVLDRLIVELAKHPHEIDVRAVQDLLSLLPRPLPPPPEKAWIPEIRFVTFDGSFRRMLKECAPALLRDTVMKELATRIGDLENENAALHGSVRDLQGLVERCRVTGGLDDAPHGNNRAYGAPNNSEGHAANGGGNVVRLSR